MWRSTLLPLLLSLPLPLLDTACSRRGGANFDEALADTSPLPELRARDATAWPSRRAELRELCEQHLYGRTPPGFERLRCRVDGTRDDALSGLAERRLLHLDHPDLPAWEGMDVLVYVPKHRTGPVPCFVALNFQGNHAIGDEEDVPITRRWVEFGSDVVDHHATPRSRGSDRGSWPLRAVLEHGFALATAFAGDLEPDHADGWRSGLRGAIAAVSPTSVAGDAAWGAIGAWAWGLSRIADQLAADPAIDARRLAVLGHSRLGKAALWAGAQDERFALVVANESGKAGASLLRRNFGERPRDLATNFPWWVCPRFVATADRPAAWPVDAHMVLALVAPRLLYVSSASGDLWADPRGEFLGVVNAAPVWPLLGVAGVAAADTTAPPPIGVTIGDHVGYHVRTGEHALSAQDWSHFLAFARRHWAP